MEFISLTQNVIGPRREQLDGREYVVVPITSIVPGVLPGSRGPLLYPPEEVSRNTHHWDDVPLTMFHPLNAGRPSSVRDGDALKNHGIGFARKSAYNSKLVHEGWFDVEKVKAAEKRFGADGILNKLLKGEPIETSTGLYTDDEPAAKGAHHNGRVYDYVARNYRPDHIALLPNQKGACSINDGCGINVNRLTDNAWTDEARAAALEARRASAAAHEATGKTTTPNPSIHKWVHTTSGVADRMAEQSNSGSAAYHHKQVAEKHRELARVSDKAAHLAAAKAHSTAQAMHSKLSLLTGNIDHAFEGTTCMNCGTKFKGRECPNCGTKAVGVVENRLEEYLTDNTWSDEAREAALEARKLKAGIAETKTALAEHERATEAGRQTMAQTHERLLKELHERTAAKLAQLEKDHQARVAATKAKHEARMAKYKRISTNAETSVAELVLTLMHAATGAHLLHLQTRSFAEHAALDEMYKALPELADAIAEAWQGKHEVIEGYARGFDPPTDPLAFVESLVEWFATARAVLDDETELQNMADEVAGFLDKTLYKLRFLS